MIIITNRPSQVANDLHDHEIDFLQAVMTREITLSGSTTLFKLFDFIDVYSSNLVDIKYDHKSRTYSIQFNTDEV